MFEYILKINISGSIWIPAPYCDNRIFFSVNVFFLILKKKRKEDRLEVVLFLYILQNIIMLFTTVQ